MKLSSKRRVSTAAALILLALFLVRPGVSRLKARIANSIGSAVARPVEIGSVHLRFLPPGFDLKTLVIYEDPQFGAEPMLRAPEVTATVRLTSLVRGRLDISRLELTEPSLNLVRRPGGHWNWAALLQRAANSPLAPTAKSNSEARPGFPYIEATSGRINFKAGQEKTPYALLNANFSLWQESEDTWGARLEAEPLRTDMSLTDAGRLRMNGTWRRAADLRETPLQFTLQWDRAQLGQLTTLISGNDRGWRGEARLQAALSGTPSAMKVVTDTSVENFRRYDISSGEGLRLATHCEATYHSTERMMRAIRCSSPAGKGTIILRGDAGLPGVQKMDLALSVDDVPMSSVVQLARRIKKDLPADLISAGSVQADFVANQDGAPGPIFRGRGQVTDLRLQSANTKGEFAASHLPFALSSHTDALIRNQRRTSRMPEDDVQTAPNELHVEFGPFPVALGRPVPAEARGWVGRSGYRVAIHGDSEVSRALSLASLLGLPAISANVEGNAQMALQIAGAWTANVSGTPSGFSFPVVTGVVQLHGLQIGIKDVSGPIEVSSAELRLASDGTRVEKLNARAGGASWTGTLNLPRGCGSPAACMIGFNLHAEEIGLSNLYESLNSQPDQRQWYQVLSRTKLAAPSFLKNLRASGKVTAGRLLLHDVVASRVSASLDLDRGKLKIADLHADLFGGKYRGDWHADFTGGPPVYAGSGTMSGISLQQIADAMHDPWISGTAGGTYQFTASGADSIKFWQAAEGELQFDVRDGVFSHVLLAGDEDPLRVERGQGSARLRHGKIEIEKGQLVSPAGTYEISGSASLSRLLDLKLTQGADIKTNTGSLLYSITGTVAEPRVAVIPTPETRAQLKP